MAAIKLNSTMFWNGLLYDDDNDELGLSAQGVIVVEYNDIDDTCTIKTDGGELYWVRKSSLREVT